MLSYCFRFVLQSLLLSCDHLLTLVPNLLREFTLGDQSIEFEWLLSLILMAVIIIKWCNDIASYLRHLSTAGEGLVPWLSIRVCDDCCGMMLLLEAAGWLISKVVLKFSFVLFSYQLTTLFRRLCELSLD